jgi:hypothetical protein
MLWCDGALVRWCDGALVRWCDGAMVRWCDGAMVRWCEVNRCSSRSQITDCRWFLTPGPRSVGPSQVFYCNGLRPVKFYISEQKYKYIFSIRLNIKTHPPANNTHIFSLALLQLLVTNPTGDDAYLDRMALISQVLLQPRLLQLRNENEELKLKLFWKDHSQSKLKKLMIESNQFGPQCRCIACALSGKMEDGQTPLHGSAACIFKPWFEDLLAKHGLTAVTGVRTDQTPTEPHMSMDGMHGVYDVDAHFYHPTSGDWVLWTYGAKLWKAKYVHDAELHKLSALFQSLSEVGDD